MNINELEELAKEWDRFDADNEYSKSFLELIAAYREAVAEIHTCAIDEYFDGHGSLQGGAINTAKRLGVE